MYGIEFAVMPRSLKELEHDHLQTVANGTKGSAHGGGSLTFSWARVHDDETASDIVHAETQAGQSDRSAASKLVV
jgi:hypothetical protein